MSVGRNAVTPASGSRATRVRIAAGSAPTSAPYPPLTWRSMNPGATMAAFRSADRSASTPRRTSAMRPSLMVIEPGTSSLPRRRSPPTVIEVIASCASDQTAGGTEGGVGDDADLADPAAGADSAQHRPPIFRDSGQESACERQGQDAV